MAVAVNESSVVVGIIQSWKKFGIFDIVLPFLLVFSIIYGVLGRTKVFGEKGPAVNAIIAFTIAMTSVLTGWFISFITGFLPWVSIISIVIVCGLMLVAMFAKDIESWFEGPMGAMTLKIGAGIVVISLGGVLVWMLIQGTGISVEMLSPERILASVGLSIVDFWGIVFFLAFIVVIYYISKAPSEKKGGG